MSLNNTSDLDPNDEINHFLRGRMVSSMEGFWRIMGYQMYPASDPPVTTIKIKKHTLWKDIIDKNLTCDFDIWLNRPEIFNEIKFEEFFSLYDYSYTCPRSLINRIQNICECTLDNFICAIINIPQILTKNVYLYKLRKRKIIRLNPVNIFSGEDWYFRLLVKNMCFNNYESAKECNGIKYRTYQEACAAYGLLENENEAEDAFNEVKNDGALPKDLRAFFVTLTVQGIITLIFN